MTWCFSGTELTGYSLKGLRCDHCGKFISYKSKIEDGLHYIEADLTTELEFIPGARNHIHRCQECQIKEREYNDVLW